jgi:hypothetical protein
MKRFIIASILSGLLFGLLDGVINANPVATGLYAVFSPLVRPSINVPAGIVIDLAYGFLLAGLFLLLHTSLPGGTGLQKGMSYAVVIWFLRVVMSVLSQWMMFEIPAAALLYTLVTGLFEMLALGILYGLIGSRLPLRVPEKRAIVGSAVLIMPVGSSGTPSLQKGRYGRRSGRSRGQYTWQSFC